MPFTGRLRVSALAWSLLVVASTAAAQPEAQPPGDRPIGPESDYPEAPPPDETVSPRVIVEDRDARARSEPTEWLYLAPMSGFEYVATALVSEGAPPPIPTGVDATATSGYGVSFGGHVGFVFGSLRVGALYNRAEIFSTPGLHYDNLYAEIGIGGRQGIVGVLVTGATGYTFFGSNITPMVHGVGARLGLAFDIYIGRQFSIGPELAGYGAAYFLEGNSRIAAWGVTFGPRFGLHI